MCKQTFTGHESDINAVAVSFKLFKSFQLHMVNCKIYKSCKNLFGYSFFVIYSSISPMEMHLQQGQMMLPVGYLTSVLIR